MAEPLDDYRAKRDFGATPEPPPGRGGGRGERPVFVVHRHDARALHYDLRLEMDGVLKSWAVPRGFSYDPTEKRLAVRTEDHPIEYEHFDGVIPEGQYGAGTMTIWDRGTFEVLKEPWPAALQRGELKLRMFGRKLRGEWHMVLTKDGKGKQWLLFKSRDLYSGEDRDSVLGIDLAAAQPEPMPERLERTEAGEDCEAFSDPGWLFETELAGKRVWCEKLGAAVRLRGLPRTPPSIERALRSLRAENALIEGVLVVLDEKQRPSQELCEARLEAGSDQGLCLYAFDLAYYDEFDLRPLPLLDRKSALRRVLPGQMTLLYLDHVTGDGQSLARAASAAGLPSILAKRADAPWSSGLSPDWKRIAVPVSEGAKDREVTAALARSAGRRPSSKVKLTNLERIYWPREGFTKGDFLAYYERVADALIPYLRERPLHMNRFPDGIEGKSFYQRNAGEHAPDWIDTVDVESSSHEEPVRSIVCNDGDTLMYLANLGSIDLHPWLSRRGSLDEPDWVVLDLDAKESAFTDVIEIARVSHRILTEIGLRPLLKTSGATGMHVYIPLRPGYTYDQSRMFCEAVARLVCRELPKIATVERLPSKRGGKVYVDFGQNRRSQTVVPPYVVRPVPGACVSTPLDWSELSAELHPSQFTILTVPPRIEALGDLFRPALDDPQDLLEAIEALQTQLRGPSK
jgi:bifunctional non-homologous end joining protein LigD